MNDRLDISEIFLKGPLNPNRKTYGRTDVLTYGHLLSATVLIFRLRIPNKMPKYPTSASDLLGTYFGHLQNKWQVPNSCPNICPFINSDGRRTDG